MIRQLLLKQENLEKTAVIEDNTEITYYNFYQKAIALQSFLPQEQQEVIAILLPDSSNYIAAFWGVIQAGMIVFPINVLLKTRELILLLKQVSAKVIITSTTYQKLVEEVSLDLEYPLQIIYMDKLKEVTCENKFTEVDTDKPMLLLNTSGTTGKVKIVQLSEKNIEASVSGYLDKIDFNEIELNKARFIIATPFSSIYGIMILTACLIKSLPIVLLNNTFTLDSIYRIVEKHKVTNYEGSTSIIQLMCQMAGRFIPYNISTLKYFGFGGSMISENIIKKIQKAYPDTGFFQGYGMTEASPLIAKHNRGKLIKTASVGTAIKGVEIAIQSDNGTTCIPYEKGEIIVKGSNVMLGYYNNEIETNNVLKNGYLYTGDIGYLDEEGYLYICGRKKNIIIVRGYNVYPEEVENCIRESLLVKDCFVYGQKDSSGNETVCADIIPIDSQVQIEKVKMYCNDFLAEYKRPQKIYFCEHITKNLSGKTTRSITI